MNFEKEEKIASWLEKRVGQENFKPGLERIRPLFEPIINGLDAKVITIGGTNGKGSVSFALEKLLLSHGCKVALWSSPHVLSVRERFRLNGENTSYERLDTLFSSSIDEINHYSLSYYEFLFFNFCKLAMDANYIILEVGLGGRFDAVNLFNPHLTAITSIGRDHQAILGKSYRAILGEKLGICRPNIPLLSSFNLDYLKEITAGFIRERDIPWHDYHLKEETFVQNNTRLASELAKQILGISSIETLDSPSKGRYERMNYKDKELTFVGSHNLSGMREMVRNETWTKYDLILLSFSKRDRKEIESCIKLLKTTGTKLIVTSFEHPKAADDLNGSANWREVLDISDESSILVTGSYYFVGEVQKYIISNS